MQEGKKPHRSFLTITAMTADLAEDRRKTAEIGTDARLPKSAGSTKLIETLCAFVQ